MSSYSVPETITYKEALKITLFKKAVDLLDGLIKSIDTPAERKAILSVFTGQGSENYDAANQRTDHPFIDYKRPGTMVPRDATKDRVFPLDTVEIQGFNAKNDASIETAIIHVGPSADETARALNAVAITIGKDIYFRNDAYRPESEEGRRTLAHELTHVRQHTEKRITRQTTESELEREATSAERTETHDEDPIVTVEANGRLFSFPKSVMGAITTDVARNVEEWVATQKYTRSEEEYLKLLFGYEQWLEECR
jgi:hypothetical protein